MPEIEDRGHELTQMLGAGLLGCTIPALAQSDETAGIQNTPPEGLPAEELISCDIRGFHGKGRFFFYTRNPVITRWS